MSSFSCPKYDFAADRCMRLTRACEPGQPGCVLHGKVQFAVAARPARRRRRSVPDQTGPERCGAEGGGDR